MGRTLTCTYLKPRGEAGDALPVRLNATLLREGFSPSEEPADRWIALLSTKDSPWWFMLDSDSAMEAPFVPELRKTARKLAKTMDCDVLCAEVVDSDAFAVLFSGGKEDIVVRDAGGAYDNLGCGPRTGKGKPALWQEFFRLSDHQTQALSNVWQTEYDFAEMQLSDMLTVLGLDSTGLDIFPEEWEAVELPADYQLDVLHYKAKQKPFEIITEGETVIDLNSRDIYITPEQPACDKFYNKGGITKGAAVLLISELFREHQITFSEVTIDKQRDYKSIDYWENRIRESAPFEPITLQDGQAAMIARFPDFEFPEGIQVNKEAVTSWRAVDNAREARCILVRYTMLLCPDNIPEGSIITSVLLPKEGRAEQVIPLQFRSKTKMQQEEVQRRETTKQMWKASFMAELAKEKDKKSKRYQMMQALADIYEAHQWNLYDEEARVESDRIMKEFDGAL